MISKILTKLIDQAIVPAVMLLCTRLVSVVLISHFMHIEFEFNSRGFVFPSKEGYLAVNSYSTLVMLAILTIGILYVLVKAFIFHDTHISPHLTAHVFQYRLTTLIQGSYELYSQSFVWLSYLYLMTILSGVLLYFELIYNWVFYSSLVLTLISSVFLLLDVENEFEIKKMQGKYIEDDTPAGIYLHK